MDPNDEELTATIPRVQRRARVLTQRYGETDEDRAVRQSQAQMRQRVDRAESQRVRLLEDSLELEKT